MAKGLPNRQDVPVALTWDVHLLYPSDQAFSEALETYTKQVEAFANKYRGKLDQVDRIIEALAEFEWFLIQESSLARYAYLQLDVDQKNANLAALANQYNLAAEIAGPQLAFVGIELSQAPEELLEAVAEKESKYASFIKDILLKKAHSLTPDQESLWASIAPSFQNPYRIYRTTKFQDMSFDNFEANGQTHANSYVLFENEYEVNHDTALRRAATDAFYSTLRRYQNTTAEVYLGHAKNEQIEAKLRGFDSTIDFLLFQQNVSRDLFDRQIDVIMKDLAPHMRRYVKLVAAQHNLDKITHADLKIGLASDYKQRITPEESKALLVNCLSVLGPDYVAMIERAYDERWIDFSQNDGKSTGGYCATVYGGPSYILLSWSGLMNEVLVLAHELGHAGHFQLAAQQSILNFRPSLYFVEAPSTANEILACNKLLENNQDPDFQAYLISELLSRTYFHNMVTHLLEAAFQREVYTRLDKGDYLNGQILSQIKLDVIKAFWGPDFEIGDDAGLIWMRQPHYYMGLYPYTYSAGLTIGTAMAKQLGENPEGVVDKWLETLSLGASLSAQDLAKHAGVDVSTDGPLLETIAYVGSLVDKLEALMQA